MNELWLTPVDYCWIKKSLNKNPFDILKKYNIMPQETAEKQFHWGRSVLKVLKKILRDSSEPRSEPLSTHGENLEQPSQEWQEASIYPLN